MNIDEDMPAPSIPENLQIEDKWVISKFNTLAKEVTENLEKFRVKCYTTITNREEKRKKK